MKPRTVVEIGCASGFSAALLAALLEGSDGASLTSFHIDKRFYMDRSLPIGYLLNEALDHPSVSVTLHPKSTSLDVSGHVTELIDVCFIDAAHKHPWPLVDTLSVLPLIRPGGVIIHHDLQMFRSDGFFATGPKLLLDQCPSDALIRSSACATKASVSALKCRSINDNIFAIRIPADTAGFGRKISEGFLVGWDQDASKRIPSRFADRFPEHLGAAFPPMTAQAFKTGMKRYNPTEQRPVVQKRALRSLLRRARQVFRPG